MRMPIIFTEEEKKEFTPFNMAAMDNLRAQAQKKDEIPPCWLCLSDEAKEEAKLDCIRVYSDSLGILLTEESITTLLNTKLKGNLLEKWAWAESDRKKERENGNPRAHFA